MVLISILYIHRARVPRRVLHTSVWLLRMMGGVGFRVIDMDSLSIALSIDSTLIKQSVCVWIHYIVGPCDVGNRVRLWITTEIKKKKKRSENHGLATPSYDLLLPCIDLTFRFTVNWIGTWSKTQHSKDATAGRSFHIPHSYTCWLDITTDPNGLYDCDKKNLGDGKIWTWWKNLIYNPSGFMR